MTWNRKNITSILILIIIVIALGSFREVLFVNINNQIAFLQGGLKQNYLLEYMKFLEGSSESSLGILKWICTAAYTIAFYLIGRYFIKNILNSKEGTKWYGHSYLFFILMAAIFFFIGWASGNSKIGYSLSRSLMGALQSPIPLLIFIPVL